MGVVGICEYCNKVIESDHEPEPKQNIEKGHFVRHYLICAACCRKFLSYTIVGYDKDNDVFVEYDNTIYEDKAIDMAKEYAAMIENGELRWPGPDGEPIDWVSVYRGWKTAGEEKIWSSYEEVGENG